MEIKWEQAKNNWLKANRGISFEHIVIAVDEGKILDILAHPDKERYPDQVLILVNINNYAYVVPTEIKEETYFFKTIFPSRKYTQQYLLIK